MVYLLDTTALSALMKRDNSFIHWLSSKKPEDRLITSVISRGEILYGIRRLTKGVKKALLIKAAKEALAVVPSLAVGKKASSRYSKIKAHAARHGKPVAENDLWIAASATSLKAILVTSDSDFRNIPALKVEEWLLKKS